MNALVLDGSFVLSLLLEDEFSSSTPRALAAVESIAPQSRFVPAHFWIEVTNGLLMAERRGRISAIKTKESLGLAFDWPVVTDDETNLRCRKETPDLARNHGLTAYDAAYLELAIRRRAGLATADKALARAAGLAGIELAI